MRNSKRYTTRQQDRAFIRRVFEDATHAWQVGDACRTYRLDGNTTIAAIDGEIVTLANGDRFHITKTRRAE